MPTTAVGESHPENDSACKPRGRPPCSVVAVPEPRRVSMRVSEPRRVSMRRRPPSARIFSSTLAVIALTTVAMSWPSSIGADATGSPPSSSFAAWFSAAFAATKPETEREKFLEELPSRSKALMI